MIIEEYMKLSLEERQTHLDLNEPCLERGGNTTNYRGLLVAFLDTTFPSGRTLCCHACGNSKCSNPRHLYWGTDKENMDDAMNHGSASTPRSRIVAKYGIEEAKKIAQRKSTIMWYRRT